MERCAQLFVMIPMNCLLLPLSPPNSKSISVLLFCFFSFIVICRYLNESTPTHILFVCIAYELSMYSIPCPMHTSTQKRLPKRMSVDLGMTWNMGI